MIKIEVTAVSPISTALGTRKLEIELAETTDILGLLVALSEKHGQTFRKLMFDEDGNYKDSSNHILHNGRNIMAYEGVGCRLKDGDTVVIMPKTAGG